MGEVLVDGVGGPAPVLSAYPGQIEGHVHAARRRRHRASPPASRAAVAAAIIVAGTA